MLSNKKKNKQELIQLSLYEEIIDSKNKIIQLQDYKIAELEKKISISQFYETIERELHNNADSIQLKNNKRNIKKIKKKL